MARADTGPCARLARFIEVSLEWLAMGLLLVMVAATGYQVFGRYVMGRSPAWTEELARYAMVWLTFAGSAVVLRNGGHLTVTALYDALGARGQTALLWIRDALMIALCAGMAWASGQFAWLNRAQESAAMEIPMTIPNLALAVGFGLLALQIVLTREAGAPFKAVNAAE